MGPQPKPTPAAAAAVVTPVRGAVKRPTPDDTPVPWEANKRTRTSGPDAIRGMSRSLDGMTEAMLTCFAPKNSTTRSPSKIEESARELAKKDCDDRHISADTRRKLGILFASDLAAAKAYAAEPDPFERAETADLLLAKVRF
jgi:hypothetical protein